MQNLIRKLTEPALLPDDLGYRPVIYRLGCSEDRAALSELLAKRGDVRVNDHLRQQLVELWHCRHPGQTPQLEHVLRDLGLADYESCLWSYGVWVFYPWSDRLVHLLDEVEFVEVRTNRNCPKITREEQTRLGKKRVGVVGLSVGSAIAMALSVERSCGELRLADFDTLELSNLNRIRAPVHALSLPKAVVTAREIAELDPFLEVKCFVERLGVGNLEEFLAGDHPLDLCIEECDDLAAKLLVRKLAKRHRIAVLMETNDLGMLDVERYDLEPDLPVLHGLLPDLDDQALQRTNGLSNQDKLSLILNIVGQLSARLRAALPEVGKTLNSWPQLSSAVTRGAGVAAGAARQILLGQCQTSGRYYSVLSKTPQEGLWQEPPAVVTNIDPMPTDG